MRPPNLKEAHECGDCRFFIGPEEGSGKCTKYSYAVDDDQVCDSWAAGDLKYATKRAWSKHRKTLAA